LNYRKNIINSVWEIARLHESDIDNFINSSTIKSIKKGRYLIKEGHMCNELYYIHSGALRSFFYSNNSIHINNFGLENHFFTSFQSFVSKKPSQINIQAIQDCEISVWERSIMEKLYHEKIQWQEFGRKLAEQFFIDMESRAFSLMSEPAKIKLMQFIKKWPQIFSIAPQYDIASYIGIAPESLSRLKKNLVKNNTV